jgi:rhomboid protease GluP
MNLRLVLASRVYSMALGGFNCPFCNFYNAMGERTCSRCSRLLPPAALAGVFRAVKLAELPATKALGLLSIVIFALQFVDSHASFSDLFRSMPASTLLRFGAITPETAWSEPWRWLASCYVHMGVLHLGMNMLALADLGKTDEARIGSGLFCVSYVVTGIFGFFVSSLWYDYLHAPYITAGASGAVFGLMGVRLGERARRRDKSWKSLLFRTLLLSVLYYYWLHTNQAAHLGGLALGLLIGYFATHRLTLQRPASILVAAAVGLVLSVLSLAPSHLSPRWKAARETEHAQELEDKFDSD